jgi:hypothetical protein
MYAKLSKFLLGTEGRMRSSSPGLYAAVRVFVATVRIDEVELEVINRMSISTC